MRACARLANQASTNLADGDLIKNSFFFTLMDDTVVTRVCSELRGTAALKYDCIYQEGDIGHEMYFVVEGQPNRNFPAERRRLLVDKD